MLPITLIAAPLLLAIAGWQAAAPGAEALTVEEGGVAVHLVRFDLQRFRPEVVVTGPERLRTAARLRQERGAVAAVNGGFFDEQGRSLGLRVAGGRTVVPLRPRVDWGVLVLRPGQAQIVHSRDFKPAASIQGAIQVGPRVLVAGRPVRLKPQVARRSAVALDAQGVTLTLIVSGGPMEAGRMADLLARLGFHSALMLDGGASSQISVALGALKLDVPGAYGVPDGLVIRSR